LSRTLESEKQKTGTYPDTIRGYPKTCLSNRREQLK
jgi:hypothetical protein